MNTTCPGCATEYVVTAAEVGRRIVCAGCRKSLLVGDAGIQFDPEPVASVNAVSGRVRRFRLPANWATVLFTAGAGLVVWFTLMPVIAGANVERRKATLGEESLAHASYLKRLREQNAAPGQIAGAEDTWQKRRELLQDEVKRAEYSRARGGYWDHYGLLIGFLVLAAGAIGWTRAGQPLVRRIVGAVVVTGQLLLAFQTAMPVGCSPAARPYNSAANPSP